MDFSFLTEYYMFYVKGVQSTILLSVFTILLGIVIGVFLALMKLSRFRLARIVAASYIEFIRGTPVLVQLYIIYYGLPQIGVDFSVITIFGDDFPDIMAAILTLSINSSAYVAEIIRAGIQSIDTGQSEAARSLGLPYKMTMRYVVLPQAFRNILPALGNEFITVIKTSSIVSIIGISELMYKADTVRGNIFQPFEPLVVAAILYFILTYSLSRLLGVLERRMETNA